MKRKIFLTLAVIIAVSLCLPSITVFAHSEYSQTERARSVADGIISRELKARDASSVQELIDGHLTQNPQVSEWYVIALAQSGEYSFSAYETALLAYLKDNSPSAAQSRQKYALCLSAVGSTDSYIPSALEDSIGKQGIMSLVYGLHLLNNGYKSQAHTAQSVIDTIISLEKADGGWAVTGQAADADVTAMTLQALAGHAQENESVRAAVDRALSVLSRIQLDGGDYQSYGKPNAESTAQVIIALSSLGIDFGRDERFIKNGKTLFDGLEKYRLSDGGYCHIQGEAASDTATVQALCAAVSYIRAAEGKGGFYSLDQARPDEVKVSANGEATGQTDASPADTEGNGDASAPTVPYKVIAVAVILVICAICAALLFAFKKGNLKSYIALLAVAAIAVGVVMAVDFKSADSGDTAKENVVGSVTLSIRCDTVKDEPALEGRYSDGAILDTVTLDIAEGDTVYSLLVEAAKKHGLHIENDGNTQLPYIVGIANIYEFDFGDTSGWVYYVNGKQATISSGAYKVSDGDVIEWKYTKELGNDIGESF